MLKIRLARTGKKKQAQYRVVVADQKRAVTAKFIEILGWYNPHTKEIKLNKENIESWLAKGAQPSNTVAKLMKNEGSVKLPAWVKIEEKNKKPKKEVEESSKEQGASSQEETTAQEAPTEEATEEVTEAEVEAEIAQEEKAESESPEVSSEEAPAESETVSDEVTTHEESAEAEEKSE